MQTAIPQAHLRAIIAEDDAALRYTLRQIVETRCEVIAEAETGQVAVELAGALNPDIVLLDISMPILNGFEAARRAGSRWIVLVLTEHENVANPEPSPACQGRQNQFRSHASIHDKQCPGFRLRATARKNGC